VCGRDRARLAEEAGEEQDEQGGGEPLEVEHGGIVAAFG
jgi:hypothetical protein